MFRFADALTLTTYTGATNSEWTVAFRTDTGLEGHLPVAIHGAHASAALAELMGLRELLVEHALAGFERMGPGLTITLSQAEVMPWTHGDTQEVSSLRPFATFLRTRLLGATWVLGEDPVRIQGKPYPSICVTEPVPILETTSVGEIELTHHAVVQYGVRSNITDPHNAYRLLRRQMMRHALTRVTRPAAIDALAEVRHGEAAECFRIREGVILICVKSRYGGHRIAVTCYA